MNHRHIQKTFVKQHDQSDCGVACLLSLIRYYGGTTSLEKLRETSGTTRQGTSLLGLYQSAQQNGFDSQGCEADIKALIEHGKPLILHVLIEKKLEHYIVCYGYENGKFTIGDPARGIVHLSETELSEIWVSKKCLTLSPNKNFVKQTDIKRSKKKWIIRLIQDDIQLLGVSAALGVGVSVLSMALSVFSQKLIDDILPSGNMQKLISGIAFLFVLLVFRSGLFAVRQFMLLRQSKDFNNRIIDAFYSTLLYLPKPFFDTRKIGELVARLNDTSRIQRVISQIAGNVVIDSLVAIVSLVFLFTYSVQSGIIASIGFPIYFLLVYKFNKPIIAAQKEVMVNYALSESNYISTIQGINVIKNANRQQLFSNINKNIYGSFQDKVFGLGKINIRLTLLSGISGIVFLVLILLFASVDVFDKNLQIGELMAIVGISSSLLPSISNLALISIPINEAKIAFDRMFEFVNIEPEKTDGETIEKFNSLEIKNITFRFAGRKPILNNVSLSVKNSELVAIVGESGCGKSTLAQILQKFYSTENGEIIVNNTLNLNTIRTANWRKHIEVIPQEIHLFNGTILENIALSENIEPQQIAEFCIKIGLAPFIDKMPQGLMTIVGEEGVNLSGGQKQIVALARALYQKPQLLILDEATSAMDTETENSVLQILTQIKLHTSIIFITHRIHILKNISDRIYVIENGNTNVSGTHNDLMRTNNFYSRFWQQISQR